MTSIFCVCKIGSVLCYVFFVNYFLAQDLGVKDEVPAEGDDKEIELLQKQLDQLKAKRKVLLALVCCLTYSWYVCSSALQILELKTLSFLVKFCFGTFLHVATGFTALRPLGLVRFRLHSLQTTRSCNPFSLALIVNFRLRSLKTAKSCVLGR